VARAEFDAPHDGQAHRGQPP